MKTNLLVNTVLIVVMYFYSQNRFLNDMWVFYLIHYAFLFGYVISFLKQNHSKVYMVFSPILFSFFYLGISFTLGAYFIPMNVGYSGEVFPNFIKIENLNLYSIYFFITDLGLLGMWTRITSKGIIHVKNRPQKEWQNFSIGSFVIVFSIFLLLNFFTPLQSILGLMLYPMKLALIVYVCLLSITLSKKIKIAIYLLLLLIILSKHYHSKREVILVVFIIFFLESLYNNIKINLNMKFVLRVLGIVFVGVYLIFAASILRGYGNYKLDSKLDAILLVPDYVTQPYFKDAFVVNFELNTVLGNTMICMDFIENDKLDLQYGGTYLKFLLAPIPRRVWEDKPLGIILKYTYALNPDHERTGNSLPVVHYAEGFVNYYWLGFIPIILIMLFFEKMFWYALKTTRKSIYNWRLIFSIYTICILFQYIRGSGFDLFILYAIAPLPLIILITLLPKKRTTNE